MSIYCKSGVSHAAQGLAKAAIVPLKALYSHLPPYLSPESSSRDCSKWLYRVAAEEDADVEFPHGDEEQGFLYLSVLVELIGRQWHRVI